MTKKYDEDRVLNAPQPLYFKGLSRGNLRFLTTLELPDYREYGSVASPWITTGQVDIAPRDGNRRGVRWGIHSYLMNHTDFEHDSAKVFSIELIGMSFSGFFHDSIFAEGWINPSEPDGFRVPGPDYNPLAGAVKCKDCKGQDAHMIVDEGFYVPKFNPALFDKVRGARVEVRIQVLEK